MGAKNSQYGELAAWRQGLARSAPLNDFLEISRICQGDPVPRGADNPSLPPLAGDADSCLYRSPDHVGKLLPSDAYLRNSGVLLPDFVCQREQHARQPLLDAFERNRAQAVMRVPQAAGDLI